jgi:secreted trypsin-like serine protease
MFHATQFDFQTKILFGYQLQSGQKPIFMHVQHERNARKCRLAVSDTYCRTEAEGSRYILSARASRVLGMQRSLFMQVMESQV